MNSSGNDNGQPQYSNWFTDWLRKVPLVTKSVVLITVPLTIIAILSNFLDYVNFTSGDAILHGQIWRFVSFYFFQAGFLGLLVVALLTVTMMSSVEYRLGSVEFLIRIILVGFLINILFSIITLLFYLIPSDFFKSFVDYDVKGLWATLLFFYTASLLSDPEGETVFLCCFPMKNAIYPWALVALLSLISFNLLIDLILGVALGQLFSAHRLPLAIPPRYIARWETDGGLFVRLGMTVKQGFVYHPDTQIPVGAMQNDRQEMMAAFAMFDPAARREREQRMREMQESGGYTTAASNGSVGGADGDSGYNPHVFRTGRLPQHQSGTGGHGNSTSSTQWGSGGRPLGGETTSRSQTEARPWGSAVNIFGGTQHNEAQDRGAPADARERQRLAAEQRLREAKAKNTTTNVQNSPSAPSPSPKTQTSVNIVPIYDQNIEQNSASNETLFAQPRSSNNEEEEPMHNGGVRFVSH